MARVYLRNFSNWENISGGPHTISMRAVGNLDYNDSALSNEISFNKLYTPSSFYIENQQFKWKPVTNASNYELYAENGMWLGSIKGSSTKPIIEYTPTSSAWKNLNSSSANDKLKVYIRAEGPGYVTSSKKDSPDFVKYADASNLNYIGDNSITFTGSKNLDKYFDIYLNNSLDVSILAESSDNNYQHKFRKNTGSKDECSVQIKSRPISTGFTSSGSEIITFTSDAKPLDTPSNIYARLSNNNTEATLYWNAVPHADKYIIKDSYSGPISKEITSTSMQIDFKNWDSNIFEGRVQAIDSSNKYLSSDVGISRNKVERLLSIVTTGKYAPTAHMALSPKNSLQVNFRWRYRNKADVVTFRISAADGNNHSVVKTVRASNSSLDYQVFLGPFKYSGEYDVKIQIQAESSPVYAYMIPPDFTLSNISVRVI